MPEKFANFNVGRIGEDFVKEYLLKKQFRVFKSAENGSDIIAKKNGKKITIEVKTTSNQVGGIPDMHETEFIKEKNLYKFVADYLYVVRINNEGKPIKLDILSKNEIDTYADKHTIVTKIRTSHLQTALRLNKIGKTIKLR